MTNYCKCGCGIEIADNRTWVQGHNTKGRVVSDETKRKISIGLKGCKRSNETRKNMSTAQKGRKVSQETREKQSIVGRKHWEDQDEREKQSKRITKYFEAPLMRKKSSEYHKKYYAEMDDPGQQICRHHIAYDFNNPEDLTVQVTRRFHGSIHSPKGQGIHERGYSLID